MRIAGRSEMKACISGNVKEQWIKPIEGTITPMEKIKGGRRRELFAPCTGDVMENILQNIH